MIYLNKTVKNIRTDYNLNVLDEKKVNKNPFKQFEKWFKKAVDNKIDEPNAMILSTVSKNKQPSSRVVLLRGLESNGFSFYTNYTSTKGKQIEQIPKASLLFFWPKLQQQIRIEGSVKKVSRVQSEKYFNTRPFESRVGAWASAQSKILNSRNELDDKYFQLVEKYKNKPIPCPPNWGGYVLVPNLFEYWQGRPNRLHDRVLYTLQKNNNWKIVRLNP